MATNPHGVFFLWLNTVSTSRELVQSLQSATSVVVVVVGLRTSSAEILSFSIARSVFPLFLVSCFSTRIFPRPVLTGSHGQLFLSFLSFHSFFQPPFQEAHHFLPLHDCPFRHLRQLLEGFLHQTPLRPHEKALPIVKL